MRRVECDDRLIEQRLRERLGAAPLFDEALALARRVHAGQVRDDSSPYVTHPLRVALILIEEAGETDPELVVAALLHDVLEDGAGQTASGIEVRFGSRVARLVECLTDEYRGSAMPRAQARVLYLHRVARASEECLLLKLCDRIDNLRSLPGSTVPGKAETTRAETKAILLPALAGRTGAIARLATALDELLSV